MIAKMASSTRAKPAFLRNACPGVPIADRRLPHEHVEFDFGDADQTSIEPFHEPACAASGDLFTNAENQFGDFGKRLFVAQRGQSVEQGARILSQQRRRAFLEFQPQRAAIKRQCG